MTAELAQRDVHGLIVHQLGGPAGQVVGHGLVQVQPALLPQAAQRGHRQALAAHQRQT